MIDFDKKVPYVYEERKTINGKLYKVIHYVSRGPADSRMITSKLVEIDDKKIISKKD